MKTILAAIDLSDATSSVLEAASLLARAFQGRIVLAHVISPTVIANVYSPEVAALEVEAQNEESKQLSYWQRELHSDGLKVDTSELYGDPADCLRHEAKRLAADFVVIGSHGHGAMYELLVGSTASGLLRKAPCPVLIVPVTGLQPAEVNTGAEPGVEAEDALRQRG